MDLIFVVPGWEDLGVDAVLPDGWAQERLAAQMATFQAAREK